MGKSDWTRFVAMGGFDDGLNERLDPTRRLGPERGGAWTPPADVVETDEAYRIVLDVPGLGMDRLRVEVAEGRLLVGGTRGFTREPDAVQHVLERDYGPFIRRFPLPGDADADAVTATLKNGELTILLPKRPGGGKRSITVD